MNLQDYLLACLSEEAGEVTQAVGKAHRFGLLCSHSSASTKWENLRKEVHDLVAVYKMLCKELGQDEALDKELLNSKIAEIEHYMVCSKSLGRLD